MTRKDLEELYDEKYMQAGDTNTDFFEWAIAYLIDIVNRLQKNMEICRWCGRKFNPKKSEHKYLCSNKCFHEEQACQ